MALKVRFELSELGNPHGRGKAVFAFKEKSKTCYCANPIDKMLREIGVDTSIVV